MKRRQFITLLGGAAAEMWPLAARAQQSALPVIGYLNPNSPDSQAPSVTAFKQGLSETGYVVGRNVAIDYRWAEDQNDRLPVLAADLVRRRVAVIVTGGGPLPALAAKTATQTIPIVFSIGSDPVEIGLVTSLNRPGGNVTGVAMLITAVLPKRLQLLHEMVPAAMSIALLDNPANPGLADTETRDLEAAASVLGVRLLVLHASSPREIEAAFATLVEQRVDALLVSTTSRSELLVALAARHAVPAIYQWREYTAAGGLMSYGTNLTDVNRQIGVYVGRILKGEKPANLPVQQVTKVDLVINLKTAKALGLTVPLALRARADEVIE